MRTTISETTRALVPETHRITGAFSKGKPVPFYDDGDGEVYVFFLSCGPWLYPAGIVRASSWEDAYGICEDEFCDEAEETVEELVKEYGEEWMEHPVFCECYGFRPNGPRTSDKLRHGIFQKDYNQRLDGVTPEIIETHGIRITTEAW